MLFPFPEDLPDPGIKAGSPALQADSLPSETPRKPQFTAHTHTKHTPSLTAYTQYTHVAHINFLNTAHNNPQLPHPDTLHPTPTHTTPTSGNPTWGSNAWSDLPCTRAPRHRLLLGPLPRMALTWTAQHQCRGTGDVALFGYRLSRQAPESKRSTGSGRSSDHPGLPAPRAARARGRGRGVAVQPCAGAGVLPAGLGWAARCWGLRGRYRFGRATGVRVCCSGLGPRTPGLHTRFPHLSYLPLASVSSFVLRPRA